MRDTTRQGDQGAFASFLCSPRQSIIGREHDLHGALAPTYDPHAAHAAVHGDMVWRNREVVHVTQPAVMAYPPTAVGGWCTSKPTQYMARDHLERSMGRGSKEQGYRWGETNV